MMKDEQDKGTNILHVASTLINYFLMICCVVLNQNLDQNTFFILNLNKLIIAVFLLVCTKSNLKYNSLFFVPFGNRADPAEYMVSNNAFILINGFVEKLFAVQWFFATVAVFTNIFH